MEGKLKVYKSSAGSGKTYTLVKEFLRICLTSEDLYGFSRILAITFTNKATFEMKQRILLGLKQIGNQDQKVAELLKSLSAETGLEEVVIIKRCNQILTAILHSYADFGISTIDKFTHRLVRTFAKDLSLSPTFKVELDSTIILNEVIDLVIDKLGVDEQLTELLIRFAFSRMDDEKNWKVDKELFQFANEFFQEKSFPYLKELRKLSPEAYEEALVSYTKYTNQFETRISKIGKKAIDLIEKNGIEKDSFFNRAAIYMFFNRFKEFDLNMLTPTSTAIKTVEEDKWHAGKCPVDQANLIDGIKTQLADLFAEGTNYHKVNIENYLAVAEILKNLHSLSLLNHIEKRLVEYKKEEKVLNISDFNQLISGIVEHEPMPFIYERLGDKYEHLMIDEFQDTSVLQFSNLLPLVENSLAQGFENLIVGDAKQAIYRFRGGEVEQFSEMPEYRLPEIQQNGLYDERMRTLAIQYNKTVLDFNYRSKIEVVEFNNSFFEFVKHHSILSPKIENIFEGHKQKTIPSKKGGYVEIQFIEGDKKEDRTDAYNYTILKTINDCIGNGYALRDMAILVRKKADGREAAEFLKANDVNVLSSEALLLKNDATVNFLIRFSQGVFQPKADFYKKEVIEYLVENNWLKGTLNDNYQKYIHSKTVQEILDAVGVELNLKELKLQASHEFFEEIIRAFNLNTSYNVYLQFLQDIVFDYFKSNLGTIQGFLVHWEENQEKFSISTGEEVDAVSIMTIHKSKGLEFPVCIIPYAEQEIGHSSFYRQNTIWSPTVADPLSPLPYALVEFNGNLRDSSLHAAYEEELSKSQIDFMCDNYVAFTRAVDALYIFTAKTKLSKTTPSNPGLVKLPQLLSAFVDSSGLEIDEKGKVGIGELPKNENPEAKKNADFGLNYLSSKWNDKIRISASSQSTWKQNEPIQYGILMHEILGEIGDESDVEEVLQRYQKDGSLNQVEYEVMNKKLVQLLQNKSVRPFFDTQFKIKQEAGMLSRNGKLLRPDRVVYWDNKVAILDFKTGEKNDSHHEQMKEYQTVLEEICQQEVEAYLLYTETEELVKV